jgi:predicted butyrate kinase (DUF1464 family)
MKKPNETLAACVETMFRRCPTLAGFAVCEGAIQLADMTCHPAQDDEMQQEMREYIVRELVELVDQEPEAAVLLSGRTFPRVTH